MENTSLQMQQKAAVNQSKLELSNSIKYDIEASKEEEKSNSPFLKEKEVPLFDNFQLPEFKRNVGKVSCSAEFRTPNPKRPKRFFTNSFAEAGKIFNPRKN